MNGFVGAPLDRVDGRLKVTGAAKYSAEWPMPNLAHGFMVLSTIANGRIAHIDTSKARAQAGVIEIMTAANAPRVGAKGSNPNERNLPVLQDNDIRYDRQPVAVVIADTFERAQYAASLIDVRYDVTAPVLDYVRAAPYKPKDIHGKDPDSIRGDAAAALASAPVKVDFHYTTPVEHHNPMEPHATIAAWNNGALTVYDATQGVYATRSRLSNTFSVPLSDVHVITKFVGGGFGCKGSAWPHTVLAVMAAKLVNRPVKIVLWRPQMFGSVGYRPPTDQRVALGATKDGKLLSTIHEVKAQTSVFDEFVEPSGVITTMLYDSPALLVTHRLSRVNAATPTYMRAPGESTGSFALESAMDELAYATGLDPIELRLRNYAETDPDAKLPWSSKSLRECYRAGADAFNWKSRNLKVATMRDGRYLIGMGMASASYPTNRSGAAALARINADGSAVVQNAGVDIGTGAYTAFTQIAAEGLGMAPGRVRVELGDTTYPNAPVAGGSQLTASSGSAVKLAALDARAKVIALAVADPASPLHGADPAGIDVKDGRMFVSADVRRGETYVDLLSRHPGEMIEGRSEAKPGAEKTAYSMHAFGAQFAMVRIDPDLGEIRVVRQVGAFASGRIINAKTARSQYLGGMTFGVGMALLEETRHDDRTGRIMNANLSEYLLPVNADIGTIDVVIVPEVDEHVNPIGAKGIGEIGIVGAAAAIANAVYHATGKRIRDLPITPDKLLV